jgi:hypothetical protein
MARLDMADDAEGRRNIIEDLGDNLSGLAQSVAAALRADAAGGVDHFLARQMIRQRQAGRPSTASSLLDQ